MKSIRITATAIAFLVLGTASLMANNGEEVIAAVKNAHIEYSAETLGAEDHIISLSYDADKHQLQLDTYQTISWIKVTDAEGELEYQVPIGGSQLVVDTQSLASGSYSVSFMFEGDKEFKSTELIVR